MTKTVLILGASGKIGTHAAHAFAAQGWSVRRFDRKTGDMSRDAIGCDVIVNGMNPPDYHDWAGIIPALTRQVIAAARASGATVILPGNVYVFGDHPGEWSQHTPHRPCSRKGRIRADMEQAYRDSGVQTIILRAGDFIDPDRNGDILSTVTLKSLHRGKITAFGPHDSLHTHAYLPDWARAAEMLAEKRATLDRFEDIPFPGHSFTPEQLKTALETLLNRPLRLTNFPWWMMRLAAPGWELARELTEMRYLWAVPHSLSGEKFDRLLPGFEHTPLPEVLRAALPDTVLPADIGPNQPMSARPHGKLVA
ncbi:epimerase [Rhodalgimonas zhirmunskyi]|uniref:Sugar nucleotide-binding protein n=1 Tax=Rhodalgimonas zhirmunskyi TaxID=2964767 RepID=A0AAJ1UGS7_9RHOB|nr:epimerase [Rhodoalgimonas zhirmunskyi]MDQ2095892.1 sugar nucleotide-binding protein [Rhodoalgimonas zhirmunskyi]